MPNTLKPIIASAALAAALLGAPVLFAQTGSEAPPRGQMMDQPMGPGAAGQGMMQGGNMMGMMNMMSQMGTMMERCNQMMQPLDATPRQPHETPEHGG